MKILVLGAGMMGKAIVFDLLKNSSIEEIAIGDKNLKRLEALKAYFSDSRLKFIQLDVADYYVMLGLMKEVDLIISAVNFYYNGKIAKAAVESGTHYCDLGGNNDIIQEQLKLDDKAKKKGVAIIPDCGLAPGYVSILAGDGVKKLDTVETIKIRVGGLPQQPKPPLNYKIVFSALGLINEYVEPAIAIQNGKIVTIPSMDAIETIKFPEPFGEMEAFTTSGGTSTLPYTYKNEVATLDYKTIRYKGHCEKFKNFVEIGLCSDKTFKFDMTEISAKQFFAKILIDRLSYDSKDCVLARVDVSGSQNGAPKTIRYQVIDYQENDDITAMMRNTGYSASIIAQMLINGDIQDRGVLFQEISIPADTFIQEMQNRNINIEISEF